MKTDVRILIYTRVSVASVRKLERKIPAWIRQNM
jgi:hypothetical protein